MPGERARDLREQFAALRDLPPEDRNARLNEQASRDPAFAQELERLLAADTTRSCDSLLPPAPRLAEQLEALALYAEIVEPNARCQHTGENDALIGKEIDGFTILRPIGRGGMGTVYLAQQRRPARTVAIKVMRDSIRTVAALRRFEREGESLGRMQHAGIAAIFQVGSFDDGFGAVPYLAMEYVPDAVAINDYVANKRLDSKGVLRLFLDVCAAVHHAHQRGVVHRDLKPSNILVDGDGHPKIIDFGVARSMTAGESMTTLHTNARQLIGTLRYMSPEQCGDGDVVGTESDVYSLGVVLYELLTGSPPYPIDDQPIHEAIRTIRETTPTRPSTFARWLRGDVETIVLTALAKQRDRRYQSVHEMASDIERQLRGEPISARAPSLVYQLRLLARRHRAAAVSATSIFVSLVLAVIVISIALVRTIDAERRARDALALSEARFVKLSLIAASAAASTGDGAGLRRHLDAVPADERYWEWQYLDARSDQSFAVLRGTPSDYTSLTWLRDPHVAWSPDGTRIVAAFANPIVRVWDAASGEVRAELRGHEGRVTYAAFSPDSKRLVTVSADGTARLWDAASGTELTVLRGHSARVLFASFSPDGALVATASQDRTARIWDVASGRELEVLRGHDDRDEGHFANWVAFSPDGLRLATAGGDMTARVWDVATGAELAVFRGHEHHVDSVVFSSDGRRILSASDDKTARLWDAATGRQIAILPGHTNYVTRAVLDPTGSLIATVSYDGTARVWDGVTGLLLNTFQHSGSQVTCVAFSADSERLISTSRDGTVALWSIPAGHEVARLRGHEAQVTSIALSPRGNVFATAADDGTVRIWDVHAEDQEINVDGVGVDRSHVPTGDVVIREQVQHYRGLAFVGDANQKLIAAGEKGEVLAWSVATGMDLNEVLESQPTVLGFELNAKRRSFITTHADGSARIRDVESCEVTHEVNPGVGRLLAAGSSADGNEVQLLSRFGSILTWDLGGGATRRITELEHSLDGSALWLTPSSFVMGSAGKVLIVDLARGRAESTVLGEAGDIQHIARSADGRLLITSSSEGIARMWSLDSRQLLATMEGHTGSVAGAAFLVGDERVVTAGQDGTLRIWNAHTGEELFKLIDSASGTSLPIAHPDGTSIACTVSSGAIRVFSRVAYRDRYRAHLAATPSGRDALAHVEALRSRGLSWTEVAEAVRAETEIDGQSRQLMMMFILLDAEGERQVNAARTEEPGLPSAES